MRFLVGLLFLLVSCWLVYTYFSLALPSGIALAVAVAVACVELVALIFSMGHHARGTSLKMFGWLLRVTAPLLLWPAAVLLVRSLGPGSEDWHGAIAPILGAGVASLGALLAGGLGTGSGGEQARLWSLIAALAVVLLAGLVYLPHGWRAEAAAWSLAAAIAIFVAGRGLVLPRMQRLTMDAFGIVALVGMALNVAALALERLLG